MTERGFASIFGPGRGTRIQPAPHGLDHGHWALLTLALARELHGAPEDVEQIQVPTEMWDALCLLQTMEFWEPDGGYVHSVGCEVEHRASLEPGTLVFMRRPGADRAIWVRVYRPWPEVGITREQAGGA